MHLTKILVIGRTGQSHGCERYRLRVRRGFLLSLIPPRDGPSLIHRDPNILDAEWNILDNDQQMLGTEIVAP